MPPVPPHADPPHRCATRLAVDPSAPSVWTGGYRSRLIAGAAGYVLALALTCVAFVWTRSGQQLDSELLPRDERGGGYAQQTVLREPADTVLSFFGAPSVIAALVAALLLVAACTGRFWTGVTGVGIVLCSVALARVLKLAVARPDLGVVGSTTHNSFPSGHVAAAAGLLLAFVLVLPPPARWWLAGPGFAGVATVSAATMISGWHRLSDVLGGLLLAAAVSCLAASLFRYGRPVPADARRGPVLPGTRAWLGLSLGGAGLGTVAALTVVDGTTATVLGAASLTVLTLVPTVVLLPVSRTATSTGARPAVLR